MSSMWSQQGSTSGQHREVLRLAVPAFVTLVAEPLFLLADSVVVGHLGVVPLAALGIAAAALTTAGNIFVFLAYGTTGAVSRRLGADDPQGALGIGVDGLWLAALLGAVTAVAVGLLAPELTHWLGATGSVSRSAVTYLQISAVSLPAILINLAATGVLRGLQDTRTPLVVAVIGFPTNIVLNVTLVYAAGWGIAGSAWGTTLAQIGMAVALMTVVVRLARNSGASLRAHPLGLLGSARTGLPLLIRSLSLRAVLLVTTWVAAGLGVVSLAAYQVSSTIWTTLTLALDALAIAGQALTGRYLGGGDVAGARGATRLMLWWGVGAGVVFGVGLIACSHVLPSAFTGNDDVRTALATALVVIAIGQPVSGWVFVLDGVLIGAGDARWLAMAQLALFVGYLPVALLIRAHADTVSALWWGFLVWMLGRAVSLGWRARSDAWLVVGAIR